MQQQQKKVKQSFVKCSTRLTSSICLSIWKKKWRKALDYERNLTIYILLLCPYRPSLTTLHVSVSSAFPQRTAPVRCCWISARWLPWATVTWLPLCTAPLSTWTACTTDLSVSRTHLYTGLIYMSSQLADPLWTGPGLKCGNVVHELISTGTKRAQGRNYSSNIPLNSSHVMKTPPPLLLPPPPPPPLVEAWRTEYKWDLAFVEFKILFWSNELFLPEYHIDSSSVLQHFRTHFTRHNFSFHVSDFIIWTYDVWQPKKTTTTTTKSGWSYLLNF